MSERLSEELGPCPFCGSNSTEISWATSCDYRWFFVMCNDCESQGPTVSVGRDVPIEQCSQQEKDAAEKWNMTANELRSLRAECEAKAKIERLENAP